MADASRLLAWFGARTKWLTPRKTVQALDVDREKYPHHRPRHRIRSPRDPRLNRVDRTEPLHL